MPMQYTLCCICREAALVHSGIFCERCANAYDRWNRTPDNTHWDLIIWVANRTRRMERARHMKNTKNKKVR
jgi:hypothetical protein